MRLADDGGLEALSMRRLGDALRVEAMSLYRHVANKDDLLDGIVDAVFEEIGRPDPATPWRTAIRERARSAREVLVRHPWAVGLLDSRRTTGPATLGHHDAVLGSLRRAGFSPELAVHAFALLDSYIYGFVIQETRVPFRTTDELADLAAANLANGTAEAFPYVAEVARTVALQPGYSFGAQFDFGLELILDGLEQAVARDR